MHPILNVAICAVRAAGNSVIKHYEVLSKKRGQKNSINITTNVYKTAKSIMTNVIQKFYPKHTIITEEDNACEDNNQKIHWIIDPLDGIINFIKCLPYFAISVAVRINNCTEVAVVYDPIRNELFTAIRGSGVQLNGYRLRNSNDYDPNNTILAIGFPLTVRSHISAYIDFFSKIFTKCSDFRRIGSAALDLSYVAANRIDGYFEVGLRPYSVIAGELIVREAGAIVCDFTGGHNYLHSGSIIAGGSKLVKVILSCTRCINH